MHKTTFQDISLKHIHVLGYHLLLHELHKFHTSPLSPWNGWILRDTVLSIQAGTLHTYNTENEFLTYSVDLYIIGHYEIDSVNKINCPGTLIPWARLMSDLQTPHQTVMIRRNGIPIAWGYFNDGTTYAPLRKVAEALGYTVSWNEKEHIVDLMGTPIN